MSKPSVHLQGWEAQRKHKLLAIIKQARDAVEFANKHTSTHAKHETIMDYKDTAACIFGKYPGTESLIKPRDVNLVIKKVQTTGKVSTIRKRATAINLVSAHWLNLECKKAETSIANQDYEKAEKILGKQSFSTLVVLSKLKPADYRKDWKPNEKRQSKKKSLRGIPRDWREYMAIQLAEGQFKIPAFAAFLTGCRPAEIKKGITFVRIGDRLRARIRGAKVTEHAGQEWRCFDIAQHPIKKMMFDYMDTQPNQKKIVVRVGNSNSLTTCIRALAKKLWPKHKHSITSYSSRHAMAADCKRASLEGGVEDLATMALGHRVDKTASYYGSLFQSGGISMAPSNVKISRAVKNKLKQRLSSRKTPRATVKSKGARMS